MQISEDFSLINPYFPAFIYVLILKADVKGSEEAVKNGHGMSKACVILCLFIGL